MLYISFLSFDKLNQLPKNSYSYCGYCGQKTFFLKNCLHSPRNPGYNSKYTDNLFCIHCCDYQNSNCCNIHRCFLCKRLKLYYGLEKCDYCYNRVCFKCSRIKKYTYDDDDDYWRTRMRMRKCIVCSHKKELENLIKNLQKIIKQ